MAYRHGVNGPNYRSNSLKEALQFGISGVAPKDGRDFADCMTASSHFWNACNSGQNAALSFSC
jgi:hypothetical protein